MAKKEKTMLEILEIDPEVLAEKSKKYVTFLVESKISDTISPIKSLGKMLDIFDEKDVFFLAIGHLTEKAMKVTNSTDFIKKISEETEKQKNNNFN